MMALTSSRALSTLLDVRNQLIAVSEDAVEVVVGLFVVEKFTESAASGFDASNHFLCILGEGGEVAEKFGAALDDFLDGFFFGAGNLLIFLDRHAGEAAANVHVTITEQTFGDESGDGVCENVFLVAAVDTHVHFDVAVFVLEGAGSTRDKLNSFDVADFDAIEFDGSALGEARDFGKKSLEAIFGTEDTGASDVENAGGENGEADENEKPDAEFRPGELFSLRHLSWPPECDD